MKEEAEAGAGAELPSAKLHKLKETPDDGLGPPYLRVFVALLETLMGTSSARRNSWPFSAATGTPIHEEDPRGDRIRQCRLRNETDKSTHKKASRKQNP